MCALRSQSIIVDGAVNVELAREIEEIDAVTPDDLLLLEVGDLKVDELQRCASEGRLRTGDRVLHDTGKAIDEGGDGHRPGTVVALEGEGKVRVRLDAMRLDKGPLVAKELVIDKLESLSKAPPETVLMAGDSVRVAQDAEHMAGFKWQYGIVRYVHHNLLVDINYDGGRETSRSLPA